MQHSARKAVNRDWGVLFWKADDIAATLYATQFDLAIYNFADPQRIKFHTGSSAIILRQTSSSIISAMFLP
jgi:hypothetical protein